MSQIEIIPADQNRRTRYAVLLLHTGGPADVSWIHIWNFLRHKLSGKRLVDPIPSWLWTPFLHLCVLPWRVFSAQQAQKSMWIYHSDPIVDAYAQPDAFHHPDQPDNVEETRESPCSPAGSPSSLCGSSEREGGKKVDPFSLNLPRVQPLNMVSASAMRNRHHTHLIENVSPSSVVGVSGTARTVFNSAMNAGNKKHIESGICKPVSRGYSPSVYYTAKLCYKVQQLLELRLKEHEDIAVQVECAFAYQGGSIEKALERFHLLGDYSRTVDTDGRPALVREEHLLLLPLFPQYSSVVTSTIYDIVMQSAFFQKSLKIPHIHFRSTYCANPHYIVAMERHIRGYFHQHGPPSWLFVVFSSALKGFLEGDNVYEEECCRTFAYLRRVLGKRREIGSGRSVQATTPSFSDGGAAADPLGAHRSHSMSDSEYGTRPPTAVGLISGRDSMGYDCPFPTQRIRLIFLPNGSNEMTDADHTSQGDTMGEIVSVPGADGNQGAAPSLSEQHKNAFQRLKLIDPHDPHRVIRSAWEEEKVDGISIPLPSCRAGYVINPSMSDCSFYSLPSGKESAKGKNYITTPFDRRTVLSAAVPPSTQGGSAGGKVFVVCPGAVVEDVNTLLTVQKKVIQECEKWWSQVSYIPALNDSQSHTELVLELLAEWVKV